MFPPNFLEQHWVFFSWGTWRKAMSHSHKTISRTERNSMTDGRRWRRVIVTFHSWVPLRQWGRWRTGEIYNKHCQSQLSKQCLTGEPINRVYSSDTTETMAQLFYLLGSNLVSPGVLSMLYSLAHHFSTKNQFIWSMDITIVNGWALHVWKLLIFHYGRCLYLM